MRALQTRLWHWQSPHPDWTPGEHWPQEVSSYAIDDGTRLLLFDPLAVPGELLELATEREPMVVLTPPGTSGTRRAWSSASEPPSSRHRQTPLRT